MAATRDTMASSESPTNPTSSRCPILCTHCKTFSTVFLSVCFPDTGITTDIRAHEQIATNAGVSFPCKNIKSNCTIGYGTPTESFPASGFFFSWSCLLLSSTQLFTPVCKRNVSCFVFQPFLFGRFSWLSFYSHLLFSFVLQLQGRLLHLQL